MAKVSSLNAKIRKRWDAEKRKSFADDIVDNGNPRSPFCEGGDLYDFAGIFIDDALVVIDKEVRYLNLESSKIFKLLLKETRLSEVNFCGSTITLLANSSIIHKCNFDFAKLNGSGSTGKTNWEFCSIAEASINRGAFNTGTFISCCFTRSNISNVDFGQSVFESCLLDGVFKKCFFRGTLIDCDLSGSVMQDCAFYGARFSGCTFPKESVYFSNWGKALKSIADYSRDLELDCRDKQKIEVLLDLWSRDAELMPENLLIKGDLESMLGGYVGNMLFAVCQEIA